MEPVRLGSGIAAFLLAALGVSTLGVARARADECMCAQGFEETSELEELVMRELENREQFVRAMDQAESREATSLGANFVLWCYDADDPRCMPGSAPDDPSPRTHSSPPAGTSGLTSETSFLPRQISVAKWILVSDEGPVDAFRLRIDRPPRS